MSKRDYNNMLRESARGLSNRYPIYSRAWRSSMAFWLAYYRKSLPR